MNRSVRVIVALALPVTILLLFLLFTIVQTPLPSALAQAALEGDLAGKVHALGSDTPKDGLATALARLGQAFLARNA